MTVLLLGQARGADGAAYNALIVDGIRLAGLALIRGTRVEEAAAVSSASLVFMGLDGCWRERCLCGRRTIDSNLNVRRVWRDGRVAV